MLLVGRAERWWMLALVAAIVSLPLMLTAAPAPLGIVANLVVLAGVTWLLLGERRDRRMVDR